ncbi:uncharacterized protein LOC144059603 isoform X2 [Vanacampus margaritifer]
MDAAASANASAVIQYRDSLGKALAKNVLVLVIGLSINYINVGLMYTFCKHQIFYWNPRYILFFSLVVNDMIQMSVGITLFVISYALHRISALSCAPFILMAIITTENTPLILACMAGECYVARRLRLPGPLRHAGHATPPLLLLQDLLPPRDGLPQPDADPEAGHHLRGLPGAGVVGHLLHVLQDPVHGADGQQGRQEGPQDHRPARRAGSAVHDHVRRAAGQGRAAASLPRQLLGLAVRLLHHRSGVAPRHQPHHLRRAGQVLPQVPQTLPGLQDCAAQRRLLIFPHAI